jgi:hypothetical protein
LSLQDIVAGCVQAQIALATAQQRPLTNQDVVKVTMAFAPNTRARNRLGGLGPVLEGLSDANQPQWVSTLQTLDTWCIASKGQLG